MCHVRHQDPPDPQLDRRLYIRHVLESYRDSLTTTGHVQGGDRYLAARLYERGIPLEIVEAAFALAAVRRLFRPYDAPRLAPIRSLHYFLPVIDELVEDPPDPRYVRYLRFKLRNLESYGIRPLVKDQRGRRLSRE